MPGPGSITSYNIAPGQSEGDLDIKKKIALQMLMQGTSAAPVQHWTQALARAAQGALGGYGLYQADQEDQADRGKARDIIQALSGGTSPTTTPPAATGPAPSPTSAPVDPTAPRGFRNNNPLNIESGHFTQGQPGYTGSDGRFAQFGSMDQGQAAADKLLQVYAGKGINTIGGIVNRWAPPSDNNPTSTYASTVAKAVGVDPNAPINLGDPSVRQKIIGAMAQFENGKALPQAAAPGTAPVGAPVDQPRGGLGDERRQQLIAALSQTRAGAPFAQQLFGKELEREATRARPLTEAEKQTYPGAVALKANGEPIFPPQGTNVTLNTEKKGQEALAAKAVDAYTNAQDASKESQKRIGVYDQMSKAAESFTPGASAEMKLTAKRWMKEAGLIKGEDVPDQEAFKMLQQQLAVHAQPKGQGAVSNFERDMFAKALPNMSMSPDGLKQAISINRKLEQFDMNVAGIYRDSARKNGGIPNYLEVQDKIAGLGSPLSDAETLAIQNAGKAPPAAAAPAQAAAPAAPPAPQAGTVKDGWRFKGGDPGKQESWEQVQ